MISYREGRSLKCIHSLEQNYNKGEKTKPRVLGVVQAFQPILTVKFGLSLLIFPMSDQRVVAYERVVVFVHDFFSFQSK